MKSSVQNACEQRTYKIEQKSVLLKPPSNVLYILSASRITKIVVVTQLFPRDGGMTEDHGAPEAEQLPKGLD